MSVITTSLPRIATSLNVDVISMRSALISYMVALAIFIPISSWMADRWGAESVFRAAMTIFMLSSILCGMATALWQLVAFRFLQGAAGAMMMPVGRAILVRSSTPEGLANAFMTLTLSALIGSMVGPSLGGVVSTYYSWRMIFFVNVPACVLGLCMSYRFMKRSIVIGHERFSLMSYFLLAIGLAFVTVASSLAEGSSIFLQVRPYLFAGGVAFLLTHFWIARHPDRRILDLSLFNVSSYRVAVLGGGFYRAMDGAITILVPLMLQLAIGLSAIETGVLMGASLLGAAVMKPVAPRLLKYLGFRTLILWNGALSSCSVVGVALVSSYENKIILFAAIFFSGALRSLHYATLIVLNYVDVAPASVSRASSLSSVMEHLCKGVGVTAGTWLLTTSITFRGEKIVTLADFRLALSAMSCVAMLSALSAIQLPKMNRSKVVTGPSS